MRIVRPIASVVSWVLAAVGVVAILILGATRVGWIQPLIVLSGSMEPTISTGDLLVARSAPTADLEPGDVATLSNARGTLVTHRVVEVERTATGATVRMQGDANDGPDAAPYEVGATYWRPMWHVPAAGRVVEAMRTPAILVPLATAAVALFIITGTSSREDEH